MKYQYTVKGVDYEVEIQDIEGNIANVTVNGIPFEVEMKQPVKAGKQKVKLSEERRVKNSTVLLLQQIQVLQQTKVPHQPPKQRQPQPLASQW